MKPLKASLWRWLKGPSKLNNNIIMTLVRRNLIGLLAIIINYPTDTEGFPNAGGPFFIVTGKPMRDIVSSTKL